MNEDRIRKRQSYEFWKNLYEYFKKRYGTKDINLTLQKIHKVLDEHRAYGSETNSYYNKESLSQILKDRKEEWFFGNLSIGKC